MGKNMYFVFEIEKMRQFSIVGRGAKLPLVEHYQVEKAEENRKGLKANRVVK